jgi:Tfp pilus assembly protein PilP
VTRGTHTIAAALLASLVGIAPATLAQTPGSATGQAAAASAPPGATPAVPAPESQAGYSYDPAGRRDPFVSLVRRGNENAANETGVRPAGLSGIAVSELTLKGTMQSREGYVGLVQGPDLKTYIVKPGDKLLDGTIRAITGTGMVLMQQVNDPLSLEKQREVRKVLRQADEVK